MNGKEIIELITENDLEDCEMFVLVEICYGDPFYDKDIIEKRPILRVNNHNCFGDCVFDTGDSVE